MTGREDQKSNDLFLPAVSSNTLPEKLKTATLMWWTL